MAMLIISHLKIIEPILQGFQSTLQFEIQNKPHMIWGSSTPHFVNSLKLFLMATIPP